MRTSGKNLARRTITPRLSELITEVYELLKAVHPNTKNFAVLIGEDEEEIDARILPLTGREMNEFCEATDNEIGYIAYTDEDNNFIGGEERWATLNATLSAVRNAGWWLSLSRSTTIRLVSAGTRLTVG